MPYCPQCGTEVRADYEFCPDCGHELGSASAGGGEDPAPGSGGPDSSTSGVAVDAPGSPVGTAAGGRPAAQRDAGTGTPPGDERAGFTTGQKLLFAGAGITALGALLPWLTADVLGTSVSKRGIEGDGVLTIGLGVLAGGLGLVRWGRVARGSIVVAGSLIALLGLLYVSDPLFGVDLADSANPELLRRAVQPGVGLYLTVLGGLTLIAGSVLDSVG